MESCFLHNFSYITHLYYTGKLMTTESKRILTGITTTGIPHLGNYVGAIRPAIQSIVNSTNEQDEAFFFLADYHGIIKCYDPAQIHASTRAIACAWLACGLDPEKVTFYRQSDIPEIPELTWILNCSCAKGLMNRAHAYKASVDVNMEKADVDPDQGITMGLFSYPVLMSADKCNTLKWLVILQAHLIINIKNSLPCRRR